jgi:hypothetical protein
MEKAVNPLKLGALVRDTERNRVGEVRALLAGRVYLRPPGGGLEWDAHPDNLEPADAHDQLSFRVRQLNLESSGGVL